jgi:hypothetical protein
MDIWQAFYWLCRKSKLMVESTFTDKTLGRFNGDLFLCELFPLPKRSKDSIDDYKSIWNSIDDYYKEVLPKRIELIFKTLQNSPNVKLIIKYGVLVVLAFSSIVSGVKEWNYDGQKYTFYKMEISPSKFVLLLHTPFFGQGRVSLSGIQYASEILN